MNNNTRVLEKKINKELKGGNVKSAITLCQMEIQSDPTNANLHLRLGDLYMAWHLDIYTSCQYIDEAIKEYNIALESCSETIEYENYFDKSVSKMINLQKHITCLQKFTQRKQDF